MIPDDLPVMLLECDTCSGDGFVLEGDDADEIAVECPDCQGTGWR